MCFVNHAEMHQLPNVLEIFSLTAWHASVWKRKDRVNKRMHQGSTQPWKRQSEQRFVVPCSSKRGFEEVTDEETFPKVLFQHFVINLGNIWVIRGECTFLQTNLWEENPLIVVAYSDFSVGSESSLKPGRAVRGRSLHVSSAYLALLSSALGSYFWGVGTAGGAHRPLGLTQNRNLCVFSSSLQISETFALLFFESISVLSYWNYDNSHIMQYFHPPSFHLKTPQNHEEHLQCTSLFLESTGVADMFLREALHLPHFLQNSFCSAGIMFKVIDDGSKCQPLFAFTPNKGFYFANRQTNILRKLSRFYGSFRDILRHIDRITWTTMQTEIKSHVTEGCSWIFKLLRWNSMHEAGGSEKENMLISLKDLHKSHHTW